MRVDLVDNSQRSPEHLALKHASTAGLLGQCPRYICAVIGAGTYAQVLLTCGMLVRY